MPKIQHLEIAFDRSRIFLLTTFDVTRSLSKATSDKTSFSAQGSSWISIRDFPAGGVDIASSLTDKMWFCVLKQNRVSQQLDYGSADGLRRAHQKY